MKAVVVVLVVILALVFLGGAIRVGGDSLLGHVDSVLGITLFSDVYYTLFFFMHEGVDRVESGYKNTDRELRDFQKKPLGFDKQRKYRELNDAAKD